ncbi:MAG: hypothetical protein WC212_03555, partial [Candidatus Delongbacteria bacterium]
TFTGGFGFIMNDSFNYGKKIDFSDPSAVLNDDVFIAWEMDFKARIVMYDRLQLLPYFAFMVPSDNFAYNKVGSLENFDEDLDPATDMQFKIGITTMYNF